MITIFKNVIARGGYNLSAPITVTRPTVNIGITAEYTPYRTPETTTFLGGGTRNIRPTFADGITLIPSTPAIITATYTRDSTKVINNIFELIAEIQDIIAT